MRLILETPLSVEDCASRLNDVIGKPRPALGATLLPICYTEWEWGCEVIGSVKGDMFRVEKQKAFRSLGTPLLFAKMARDPLTNVTVVNAFTRQDRVEVIGSTAALLLFILMLALRWCGLMESRKDLPGLIALALVFALMNIYSARQRRAEERFLLDFLKRTIQAVPVQQMRH